MTPPRLVHVTTTDISLALLLGPQLHAFSEAGYEVIGMSAPGPYVEEVEALGVSHVALTHATRAWAPLHDAKALLELRRLFKALRPDIVHTHNPKPGVYGRLAARASRVPVIVNTVHGLYASPEDGRLRRSLVYGLERAAATCSRAELVQNPEDLETLARLGIPRSKLHLLGNGVDLKRFDPSRSAPGTRERMRSSLGFGADEVVVGAVGRLVKEKGYRELFEAYGVARRQYPGLRLLVIGPEEPDKADALSAAELAAAAQAGAVLTGARTDMESLYTAMDLYVLASHREGFPRAAMEASAMGLPIVATDIRGCRQVVEHGRTGRLVPPRDVTSLTEAMVDLATDSGLRSTMGQAAAAKAKTEFDDRRVIDLTLATYARLLERPTLQVPS